MHIDCRALGEREIFLRLRDLFEEHAEQDISLEIQLGKSSLARRVMSFCAISRLNARTRREGDHYLVAVKGSPCRCG